MGEGYFNRYNSFCRSLATLKRSRGADINADFVLPGTVQSFNLTFDLAWKVMKDVLQKRMGISEFASGSPREVIKTSFSNGLIDCDIWLEMLKVRNLLVHDYDGIIATENFYKITGAFLEKLESFESSIKPMCKDDLDEMQFFE